MDVEVMVDELVKAGMSPPSLLSAISYEHWAWQVLEAYHDLLAFQVYHDLVKIKKE